MRYLIVNTVPKDYILKYGTSIAGGNFAYNLLTTNAFDKIYSILPSNVYNYTEELSRDGIDIIYSGLRTKSFFCRMFACFVEQFRIFRNIERRSTVWLYNIDILNIVLYCLLRFFKSNTRIYIIMADFSPEVKRYSILLPFVNRADGLISLSNSKLFKNNNLVILPGIVPMGTICSLMARPLKKNFLLSGVLIDRISNMPLILKAFSKMPDLELNITGNYPDMEKIRTYTERFSNIKYHGVVSFAEFKDILDINTFVLNTRDPAYPENQCNFPSKILEALLHNRIIISTIHYPQLDGLNYFEVSCNEQEFIDNINDIISHSDENLLTYANQANLVKEKFGISVWYECINKMENGTAN